MSKILMGAGVVLVIAGLGLAFAAVAWPAQLQLYGLMPDAGILLFVGGLIVVGLSGVIDRIETLNFIADAPVVVEEAPRRSAPLPPPPPAFVAPVAMREQETREEETFSAEDAVQTVIEKAAEVEAAAVSALATTRASLQAPADAVMALERARAELSEAVSLERAELERAEVDAELAEPAPEAVLLEETVEETVVVTDEGTLYIIEERVIHGRPSRLLSDGTVEAETEEGWMRFENAEHLEEYLEAMGQSSSTV